MEVDMHNITSAWTELIQQFLPIFTTPAAQIFIRLITGWILCTTRRTVTGIIPFADALEQLGYQAEAATWRNNYLTAAYELRNGARTPTKPLASFDVTIAMTIPMIFDFMAVQFNGSKADGKTIILNWNFTDVKEKYILNLENSALTYIPNQQAPNADATLTLTRATLNDINLGKIAFEKEIAAGHIVVNGDGRKFGELMGMLDTFKGDFNIVTP
jgi:alkyl sulfatase BDS1-like metallo-beta-lactamase superfamily hydrolase